MASWYLRDDHTDSPIGPMDVDELVARTRDGSLTGDARVYAAGITEGWQPVSDVPVVGPLLDAVAAGRPTRAHWQRLQRRRADGTLWRYICRWQPFLAGVVVFVMLWPRLSDSTVVGSVIANGALVCVSGFLAQIAWYFVADDVRDRRARAAARTPASGAGRDEAPASIFVYELTPEARARLKEFDAD